MSFTPSGLPRWLISTTLAPKFYERRGTPRNTTFFQCVLNRWKSFDDALIIGYFTIVKGNVEVNPLKNQIAATKQQYELERKYRINTLLPFKSNWSMVSLFRGMLSDQERYGEKNSL